MEPEIVGSITTTNPFEFTMYGQTMTHIFPEKTYDVVMGIKVNEWPIPPEEMRPYTRNIIVCPFHNFVTFALYSFEQHMICERCLRDHNRIICNPCFTGHFMREESTGELYFDEMHDQMAFKCPFPGHRWMGLIRDGGKTLCMECLDKRLVMHAIVCPNGNDNR